MGKKSSITSRQSNDSENLPIIKLVKTINTNDSYNSDECDENQQQSMNEHDERKVNTKVSYEIMPGFRYNSKVLFCPDEQQFYVANSVSEIGHGYTCYIPQCKCRIHMRDNECYVGNAIAHKHEKKTAMYHNLCALNEMKRILRSADNQFSPRQVFNDVIKR